MINTTVHVHIFIFVMLCIYAMHIHLKTSMSHLQFPLEELWCNSFWETFYLTIHCVIVCMKVHGLRPSCKSIGAVAIALGNDPQVIVLFVDRNWCLFTHDYNMVQVVLSTSSWTFSVCLISS